MICRVQSLSRKKESLGDFPDDFVLCSNKHIIKDSFSYARHNAPSDHRDIRIAFHRDQFLPSTNWREPKPRKPRTMSPDFDAASQDQIEAYNKDIRSKLEVDATTETLSEAIIWATKRNIPAKVSYKDWYNRKISSSSLLKQETLPKRNYKRKDQMRTARMPKSQEEPSNARFELPKKNGQRNSYESLKASPTSMHA